jgi:hypothetical protein
MAEEPGVYQTTDLALAVSLALAGLKYKVESLSATRAVFSILYETDDEEETLSDVIENYLRWEHTVEVHRFVAKWGEMRRAMFDVVPPRPARPRPAPAS